LRDSRLLTRKQELAINDLEDRIGHCPASLLLLSSLVTERPNKERVQAIGLDFQGDEEKEFSKLLRIPYGRFVPPFLAAHQKTIAPPEFMSKLQMMYKEGGFKFEQSTGVRSDHIGVVLEFLALLESEERKPTDELQALIAAPFRQFASALGKATKHPLYKKVSEELTALIEKEIVARERGQN
jgi:TorA maturation chaperone TorD